MIDETVVPRRASQLAVMAGSDPDPLPVARADLLYLWDEYGTEYLDFAAVMHPFGHRFQPIRDLLVEHMRYYGWTAPVGRHLLRWPAALAETLERTGHHRKDARCRLPRCHRSNGEYCR